jgi:hypothetical protein
MDRRLRVLRGHFSADHNNARLVELNSTDGKWKWNQEPNEKEKTLLKSNFATKVVSKGNISSHGFQTALSTPIVARYF